MYKFNFDRIFDMSTKQIEVYNVSAKPILESVLEGFNGTILTYGQTSSGKTFTMEGVCGNVEYEGIIPRIIKNVFDYIRNTTENIEFTVKVSMVEIYMEKIKDLIEPARHNLNIREDKVKGIYIEDLTEHYVACEEEVLDLMKCGSENRTIGQTKMNEHSSRSHSIFIMTIYQNNLKSMIAKTGKLFLVDLAGSEKISKTGATGLTLEQAKNINKSLTTLGMVINNLTDGKSNHIPYRDSKLTRVLQESLGGNSKTCLIITCSPSIYNHHETISTLRFGERAKRIKNKPKINKEVTVAELKIEIENLERIIDKSNKRILQLSQFIEKNNLLVPSEDDYTFMNTNENKIMEKLTQLDLLNDININNINNNINLTNEETKYDYDYNYKIDFIKSSNNLKLEEIKKDLEQDMLELGRIKPDDDKKNVSEHLDCAINTINKLSLADEEKKLLQKELEAIKNKHDLVEQQLYERINELQEKLDLENRAINKTELREKTREKEVSQFTFEDDKRTNLVEDKYDIFEEKNKTKINYTHGGSNSNDCVSNNVLTLTDIEAEIVKKIKEIQTELNDDDVKNIICESKQEKANAQDILLISNFQKVKIIELFELIKEKLFYNIRINYTFNENDSSNNIKQLDKNSDNNINEKSNNIDLSNKQQQLETKESAGIYYF